MVYTITNWAETGMSTGAKVAALNNLEGMYGESVSYIDSLTHASIYYTEAECAAKYFTLANDGTGSTLVCATLDGYTAEEIISAGSPSGVIGIWSGSEAAIPSGWYLCNGSNGTPDLRGRFVVGAGSHYAKGATGGTDTVTTTAAITISGHALTAAEIPLHGHGSITDNYGYAASGGGNFSSGSPPALPGTLEEHSKYTGYAGSGTAHSHTASFAGTVNKDKRQPYYALCWIQKS